MRTSRVPANPHGNRNTNINQQVTGWLIKQGPVPCYFHSHLSPPLSSESTDTSRTRQQAYPCTYPTITIPHPHLLNNSPHETRHLPSSSKDARDRYGTLQNAARLLPCSACLTLSKKKIEMKNCKQPRRQTYKTKMLKRKAKKKGQKEKRISFHIMVMIHHLVVIHRRSSVVP